MEKLKKPLLIVCGGFVILFVFMFLLSSCNKKKYSTEEFAKYMVQKTKKYYEINKNLLPQVDGGKVSLSISSLVEKQEDYLDNVTCSGSVDVINNSGYYLYVNNINCSDNYSSQKLSDYIINKDLVTSANGLYQVNDYYIYRGDSVNNYVVFNNQVYRILRINSDGSLRIIESDYKVKEEKNKLTFKINRRNSVKWDDRFNSDKNYTSGFNDYIHDGINSRLKDSLENIYKNDFSDEAKAYIILQDLCVGKRNALETINDGSIECSEIISNQYIGLLPLYEYINASLDPSCVNTESNTCNNYNYLATMKTTFWSMTAVSDNSYEVYKIGNRISTATASSSANPKLVLNLSNEIRFSKGDGSSENPYII